MRFGSSGGLLPFVALAFVSCSTERSPELPERTYGALVEEPDLSSASLAVARHTAFRAWLDLAKQTPQPWSQRLIDDGVGLSFARRQVLPGLMLTDPELALSMAVSTAERRSLPPGIAENLEVWRDGKGMLHVIGAIGDETTGTPRPTEAFVTFDGRDGVLRAGQYGRRGAMQTRDGLRLHGIELDGVFAMLDMPTRRIPPEDVSFFEYVPGSPCPTSRKASTATEVLHDGEHAVGFCQPLHADELAARLLQDEETAGDEAASAWTEGPKTLLFMRVDFDDRPGDPLPLTQAQTLMTDVNNRFVAMSFNKTQITATIPPTLRMPRTAGEYRDGGIYVQLLSDARIAARDAGYDINSFNLDIVAHPALFGGWAGRGYVGAKGTWLNNSFGQGVTVHELGHNYGAWHANFWSAGDSIIGAGSQNEYGNPFDTMGNSGASHFNAWFKRSFDWTTGGQVSTVTSSGTYRIYPLEVATPDGGLQSLKVPRNDSQSRDYWLEFRQGITGNVSLMNGTSMNFGFPSMGTYCGTTGCGSHLLDMTPGGNTQNSPLVIGRTFSDWPANLHFTPIGKGGTTPESLDIVVNFGPYPSNLPPVISVSASQSTVPSNTAVTFVATASDPNGDALAYSWDFDDGTFSVDNRPMQTRTLAGNRVYQVRCTVSDMKGGTATAGVTVTVGTPTTFTLRGVVQLPDGGAVEGARLSDGTRTSFSLSDGTWALTNVPASDAGYTLTAAKFDLAMARGFSAPLQVLGDVTGLVFTASPRPGYSLSGRVTAGGTAVQGVTVSDGTRTATTNSNGDFTLTNVPNGRYTVAATKAGWNFVLSGSLRNPIEVLGGNVGNVNFFAQGQSISGQLPSTVMTAPVVTDGYRTVTGSRGNTTSPWYYTLSGVPNGTWNVTATSPGVTLVPQNFVNPLVIAGMSVFNQNFQVAATAGVEVSGVVRTGSTPLPGVTISDGTRTATTDSLGRYVLVGVPPGMYTLTPTRAGYTFTPATRMVTVAAANLTGIDFSTTTVNAPPTIANGPTASQSPTASSTVTLSVLGADDSGEANLTYTWSLNSSGGWPVTFSTNGSNPAKSTVVTFTGAGSYVFEVVVMDAGGLSVRGLVTVVVTQTGTGMMVSPTTAAVPTGGTQFFSAQGRDQFGRFMFLGSAAWTVSGGGTIATNGQFTAGMTPGGPFMVTATAGGFTGTAMLTVVGNGAPTITQAARATPSLVTGTTTTLSVRATDDTGEPGLTYTWNASVAPAPVTYSRNASNAAKDAVVTFTQAGTYEFVVSVLDGAGNTVTSLVVVNVQPVPTTVGLTPASATVTLGSTQQFDGVVEDQFGDPLSVQPPMTWAVTGGGTVAADGLFTATMAGGPFTVSATSGSSMGTALVTVTMMADTAPPQVRITAPADNTRVAGRVSIVTQASDNVGVARVEFFDGATKLGETTTVPWQLEVDTAAWTNGLHPLTAKAWDAAGNSTTSMVVTVIVGMMGDVAPPVVSVREPLANADTGLSVRLAADASDDVGVVRVEFEVDGVLLATDTTDPWETLQTIAPGPHTVVAIAHDAAGKSTRSAAVSFTARGPDSDGGAVVDAGVPPVDAGLQPVDAGPQVDSGVVLTDAGLPPTDGGAMPSTDAGTDGPTPEPGEVVVGSCGCTGGAGAPLMLLALVALRARRRR